MKVLRRSLHKEKDRLNSPSRQSFAPTSAPAHHPPFASLPTPSPHPKGGPTNSGPPKMVIRAVTSYQSHRIIELSFQKGDFFHVVGERVDAEGEWFEASNPATGARGLVPKLGFEAFGKQPRSNSNTPRLPDFASQLQSAANSKGQIPNGGPRSASLSSKSQPLYGVVQHDFVAERPDELDAKRGEPIIVIAQSNHEWFVAKPIGRLGGPGLIPVSFVEVQDVTTGKALPPDKVKELIRSAVVPKVEEWKKATAAYKGNSIPLGRFDFQPDSPNNSSHSQQVQSRNYHEPPGSAVSHSRQHSHAAASTAGDIDHLYSRHHPARAHQTGSWDGAPQAQHSRQASSSRLSGQAPLQHHALGSTSVSNWAKMQSPHPSYDDPPDASDAGPEVPAMEGEEGDGYATVEELKERYGIVVHASVESFHYEQGHFWFHLRAHFSRHTSSPPSPASSSHSSSLDEITVLVLYRLYEDFFDFHSALVEAFPREAEGSSEPMLPLMPSPVENVDELICAQRVEELSIYLSELCALPGYIRECELVYEFLGPREGDVELEGGGGTAEARSQIEVEGEVVEYLERMDPSAHTSLHQLKQQQPPIEELIGKLSVSDPAQASGSADLKPRQQPTHSRNSSTAAGASGVQPSFLRIKLYQRQTDDLIAIRAPNDVRYDGLLQRVRERVGADASTLRFRDETGKAFSTGGTSIASGPNGARLVAIDNDQDLDRWIESGVKLVLYVD